MDLDYSPLLDESGKPAGVLAVVIETTERVRAEKALRDSEAQFRTFAAAMPNHVWSADVDGRLDWFNQQVFEYTGAGPDDLLGDGWGKVVEPQDLEGAVAAWQKALRESSVYEVQFRLRHRDGVYRWHLARAMPIRDESGKVVRWIGTNTDIDDQIRTERALRDREAELARVQQIGKVGGVEVYLTDGFRNRRSPEYLAIHGLPPEAAQRRTRIGCSASIRKIAREPSGSSSTPSGAAVGTTTPNTASCGRATDRCAGSRSRPRSSVMPRAARCGLVGAHIDITDSKLAEQAVRESEQRFRLVSESAPVMLWMGDVEGKCLYLNRMLREFWGVLRRMSAGFDWTSSLHPDDRARPLCGSSGRRCATTLPSRSRPAIAARWRVPADPHGRAAPLRRRWRVPRHDRRQRRHHRGAACRAGTEGKRGALPPDRQQRAGADVGQPPRRQARVRQSSLHGFPRPRLRGLPRLRLAQGAAPRRPARASCRSRSPARARKRPFALEARYRRGRRPVALASLGIPAAMGSGRRARRVSSALLTTLLRRSRPRWSCAASTRRSRPRSRRAHANATASGTCRRTCWWSPTRSGVWLNVNPAATAMLGWSQAELLGKGSEWLEHPDDVRQIAQPKSAHLAAGGSTQRFENRLRAQGRLLSLAVLDGRIARRADLSRSRATSPMRRRPRKRCGAPRRRCVNRRRWKPSGSSRAASPTTSTICCRASSARSTWCRSAWPPVGSARSSAMSTAP